jgi:hypothetical protein
MVLDSRWPRRHHPSCFGSERGKSELEAMLHHYQPVVMANLSDRVGLYFGAVRIAPFAIVADRIPLVLVP